MDEMLRLAGIEPESIVDGPGIRFTIFVQGCPHACPGCHNPQTHDFAAGAETPLSELIAALDAHPYLSGVTLSGGEPFLQASALLPFARAAKARGKHVLAYTGYTLEELLRLDEPAVLPLLHTLDLLVDGRFIEAERSLSLRFRGSANQRILDVPASLAAGAPVLAAGYA